MYAEVSVVVDGALEEDETFFDYAMLDDFVASIEAEASGHGYPTEVYIMYHDHEYGIECWWCECECAQYITDHHPAFSFNTEVSGQ